MSLEGIVVNGVVVIAGGQALPEGARVEVVVREAEAKLPTLAWLLKHAGTVNDLLADMAEQHDHYLHRTPKR